LKRRNARGHRYNTAKAKLPKQPEEMSIDAARLAVPRLSAA
jgi:hypothetical protein